MFAVFINSENATIITGAEESNTITNTGANVTIYGADNFSDVVENSGDSAIISVQGGNDVVTNSGNYATIDGGAGNDSIVNTGNSALIFDESGNNTISGGSGTIKTGSGNDLLLSVGGLINVGEGNNNVTIYEGTDSYYNRNNTVTGGAGNDTVEINSDYNSVNAGDGDNFIIISLGDNTIQMGNGDDTVSVDGGENSISTGDGENLVTVSADENGYGNGCNTITTGADADTIFVEGRQNLIDAEDGENYVSLSSYTNENGNIYGGQNTVTSGAGNDTIEIEGDRNFITAGDGDNSINVHGTTAASNTIFAGSGFDTITLNYASLTNNLENDFIDAGEGDNLIDIFGRSSTIFAGIGNDTVKIIGNGNRKIDVGEGNNYVSIDENSAEENPAAGSNTVTSGAGDDTIMILADSWANSIDAGDGDNYLYIDATGSTITAGEGDDTIINIGGGSFHNAGKGNNLIILNPDNGLGNTVISGEGDDTIQGFNWFDVVSLEGDYTTLLSGTNFYIQNNGHTILLTDVDKINFAPNIQGGICEGSSSTTTGGDGLDIPAGAWAVVNKSDGTQNVIYSDTVANGTEFDDTIKVAALTSGNSHFINGNGGNDSIDIHSVEQDWSDGIDNYSNVTINGGAGKDTVYIYANNFAIRDATVSIDGGADDDYIHTTGKENNVAIFNSAVTLNGGTGNDTIEVGNKINEGAVAVYAQSSLKIYGGEGDDKVTVNGGIQESAATIDGGTGNNEFNFINGQYSPFYSVTSGVISSGDGDDTVNFYSGGNNGILCSTLSVDVGNGNNLVSVKANDNAIVNSTFTIKSGTGTDTINLNGNTYHGISQSTGTINTGAGNDMLNITTNTYSGIYQATVSIDVADGDDTISIYGKGSTGINQSEVKINGGIGSDEINIGGGGFGIYYSTVTASGGAGADTINVNAESGDGSMYSRYLLDGGDESDYINISGNTGIGGGSTITATGGKGNETINVSGENYGIGGSYDSLNGGEGNDLINIKADSINGVDYSEVTFNGGIGNDTININAGRFAIAASTISIDGGTGKDLISLSSDLLGIGYGTSYDYDSDTKTWSTIKGDSSNVTINGGADADTIYINSIDYDAEVLIYAGAGDNVSVGSGGANYLFDSTNEVTINGTTFKASVANVSADIQTSDTAITLGSKWSGTVELKENYTLTDLGGSVIKSAGLYNFVDGKITLPSDDNTWKINGTTATYGTTDRTLITLTGLKDGVTTDDFSLEGTAVILKPSALGTGTVELTGDGYSLALDDDVAKVKDVAATWTVTNGTATYKGGKTSGYTLSGNKITYSQAVDSETLATITGLKSDATADGISLSGKVVKLQASVLGTDEVTLTGDGYTLALDDDVAKVKDVAATWTVTNGTATYKGGKSAGYTLSGNKVTYSQAVDSETLATITGLKSDTTAIGITASGKVVTLSASVLGTDEVTLTGDGYTLALADDVTKVKEVAASWSVSNGTATYKGGKSAGYTLIGNKITYSQAVDSETLATITGLKSDATADGISINDKVIKLSASVLGTDEVTLTGDGYTLALDDDVAKVEDVAASWSVSNGTATYKGGKTAGYTLSGNKVTYSQAVDSETLATITGLKSDATAIGITASGKVVTLSASVLGTDEVTLTGEGYTLALADDVERPTAVKASWKVSGGTATYRGSTTAGYVVENNKIIYQAASDDESIMTVTGLSDNAADSDISLENGVLTLSENAIGKDTISIEKTVDVSKISAGKAGNFLIGSQTFKTDTPADFILNSNGNVSAVELANMESTTFTNSADNISILVGIGNDVITNSGNGITFKAGLGNDTISNSGANNIFQYTKGDGDDVIVGFGESDTLIISSDTYNTSIVGGDLQVNLVKSQNTIILKDGANLTPNIDGTWSDGYFDKDGNEIKNPVAQIVIDGETYYYESVARATNDADNNSTVTVTADSTETSTINTSKGLTIQFAESGLGVYSVTGGSFISADSSTAAQFSLSSSRVLSNSNSLLINVGAMATVDGYAVTGTSNGYAFALQENSFTLNNVSYGGAGSATFDTSGNVSVTSGEIVTATDTATINLAAGSYTINGVEFSAASTNKAVTTADGVKFNLSSDTVTYNAMTFGGAGTATIQSDTGIYLTSGAVVSNFTAGQAFTFNGSGTYKLNNKTIISSATSLTVTNTAEGLTVGENTFAVTDEEFTLNVDVSGKIISVSNINGGSTIINAGGADSILTSSAGNFTFGDKTFAISGDDSVTFGLSGDGAVAKIADVIGTVGGDFTSAININGNAADVQVTGDNSINVTTSNIFGVSNNASVIGTCGASIVSTDEEGTFNFYENQNFTIGGDNSVDFNVKSSVVTGIANFENGTLQVDNAAPIYINGEYITPQFSDTATLIISDSKVVSVESVTAIDGLSNATVHATGAMTVNGSTVNVSGDSDFNIIVSDTKTTALANISAGATVSVNNLNVTTDNNGDFKVGENLYTINDADNSVTFITNSNGAVSDITNFSGTLNTNSRSVTVNGAALTTNDTSVTISSAGVGISQINGVGSGDVLSGDIDAATILVTVTSADDTALWRLNDRNYMLTGDNDGVQVTGNRIDGLDNAASLEVGSAGTYIVNGTRLEAKNLDTIIGTAEGSAYIFDPNNIPLDVSTMTDDELSAQVGISTEFATAETDTEKSAALITDSSKLNGNMELALSNSDTTAAQTADFTNSTGKKKVTLAEGSQEVKFNDEGGNVAVIESDSAGEKNITLGNGGDVAIVKGTSTPVNITAGAGKDTIVTSGNNVTVDMKGGATKIVPNGGNVNLTNYDASTGAGIQVDEVSDIERAVQNGNINFGDGVVSLGGATVNLGDSESESTTVNLFDNKGRKTKVAYTHSDGGTIDATKERENVLLVGNNNSTKNNGSILKSGAGNDIAFGGAGDYFDLGAGNNRVYLNSSGATVAMTATSGTTEVNGFSSGFDENADKISINVADASVSFKNGHLTFSLGGASLVLNFGGSSADLIEDDNLIGESADLSDITPITYEQGDYQNIYGENDSLKGGVEITFAKA